jgi:Na+-translocating ferredoxin:NAD+ oxidoreductase RnfG subunit
MPAGIIQAFLSAISGIFSAINNVFGAKNTKEMKDRQQQQKEVTHESEIEKAVKEKDVKKIRDSLAE